MFFFSACGSFAHEILAHIDCHSHKDYHALDDILQVGGYPQPLQCHCDDLQQDDAGDNAGDLSRAAGEGYAADDAGGDGVQLGIHSGGGVVGADARRLNKAGKAGPFSREFCGITKEIFWRKYDEENLDTW